MMLQDGVNLIRDENKIRDVLLLHYLKNNKIKNTIGLSNYGFEREVMEDHSIGRIDIKITSANSFCDTSEYYNCECKLLDARNKSGVSGLNAKYIANGICRFTSGYYHTPTQNVNGMIAFVVEKMDIDENVSCINCLQNQILKNKNGESVTSSVILPMTKTNFIKNFEYQYRSEHKLNGGRKITLYHLMMDFSKNVENDMVS